MYYGSFMQPVPLSVEVTVQDLFPIIASEKDPITVEIRIRNTGRVPI
jgi:hypothetical protein